MVWAGVVTHPADWAFGGYHEIQGNRRRNRLLNLDILAEVMETNGADDLAIAHRDWIEGTLSAERGQREDMWTKSLAVGNEQFVQEIQENLGVRGIGRGVDVIGDAYVLRESPETYEANFDPENRAIAPNNSFLWDGFS